VIGSLRFFENANFSAGSRFCCRVLSPVVRLAILAPRARRLCTVRACLMFLRAADFCLVVAIESNLLV
jgi:hypothetical protein